MTSPVQSRKNANYGFFAYADSFTYNSSGAVTKMQLGNGKWETAAFSERLQIAQIGLGVTSSDQNLLKLEFKYNTPNQTDNNGSMRGQKITVPTVGANPGFTATQSYAYARGEIYENCLVVTYVVCGRWPRLRTRKAPGYVIHSR